MPGLAPKALVIFNGEVVPMSYNTTRKGDQFSVYSSDQCFSWSLSQLPLAPMS